MSSKIVLNSRTKENFKISVRRIEPEYKLDIEHSYWCCGYIYIPIQNAKFIDYNILLVHGGITYVNYSQDKNI